MGWPAGWLTGWLAPEKLSTWPFHPENPNRIGSLSLHSSERETQLYTHLPPGSNPTYRTNGGIKTGLWPSSNGEQKKQKKKERKTHRMGPVEKCNWQTVETEKLQREWS